MCSGNEYAAKHGVEKLLEAVTLDLLREQPEEPLTYLGSLLQCMARECAHLQGHNYSFLIERAKAAGLGPPKGKGKSKGPPPPVAKGATITTTSSVTPAPESASNVKGKGKGKAILPPPKAPGKGMGPPLSKAMGPSQVRTVKMTATEALNFKALPCQEQDGHWEASRLGWAELADEGPFFTTVFVLQLADMMASELKSKLADPSELPAWVSAASLGEAWRTCAQEWVAANQSCTTETLAEVETRARALSEKMFPSMEIRMESRVRKVTQPTDEARQVKDLEMKEKAQKEQDEAVARLHHWQSLTPCDIHQIPWETALGSMYADGGSGGAFLVELAEGNAVCIKPKKMMAVAEFVAEYVANALRVPVAKGRVVSTAEEEFLSICMALKADDSQFSAHGHSYSLSNFLGVLEYVPGFALMGAQAQAALKASKGDLFIALGELCALDLVLNNMDRMPLPIWNNDGNLSNVMVVGDSIIGIDQQVNPIEGVGLDKYVTKLRSLVMAVCRCGSPNQTDVDDVAAVIVRLQQALLENCGVEIERQSITLVLQGMRQGLQNIARLWQSGDFHRCLESAETAAIKCFHEATTDVGLTRIGFIKEFLERVAGEVASAVEAEFSNIQV